MFIYRIANLVNGKSYIGQTRRTLKQRWQQHTSAAYGVTPVYRPLYNAMRFYGKDNFSIEILEECESLEDLSRMEDFWMFYYQSYLDEGGYNIHCCANAAYSLPRGPKTKEEMSKIQKHNWARLNEEDRKYRLGLLREASKLKVYCSGPGNHNYNQEVDLDGIVYWMQEGLSFAQVAKELKVSKSLLASRFKASGKTYKEWRAQLGLPKTVYNVGSRAKKEKT